MQKCENLKDQELKRIAHHVAEAFLAEEGAFTALSMDTAEKMFRIILDLCYKEGHLYTTGKDREGYCVYWTKKERPGMLPQLKMVWRMLRELPFKTNLMLARQQTDWTATEKRYKKKKDYVEVFLLAVRKDCQGQGHFRRMLEEVFQFADDRGTICVLDTDSKVKAEKYNHVGMRVVDCRQQKNGVIMFAMER